MRSLLFTLLAFTGISCQFSNSPKYEASFQPDAAKSSINEPVNGQQMQTVYDNYQVWQKVAENPDSVALNMRVNDSTIALIFLSGRRVDSTFYIPQRAKVILSNGREQAFEIKGYALGWRRGQRKPFVKFDDVNFDGSADLSVFDHTGAVNFMYSVYLFNENQGFSFNKDFSDVSCPKIDTHLMQVVSYFYRHDGCGETMIYHQVVNNRLKPIRYLYVENEKDACITYEKSMISGKWEYKKIGESQVSLYDSLYIMP